MIKRFISYCKNIAQTKQNIKETVTDLESVTEKEEYFNIEDTIKAHATKAKCLLHQRSKNQKIKSKKKLETAKAEELQPLKEPTAFKKIYLNALSGVKIQTVTNKTSKSIP